MRIPHTAIYHRPPGSNETVNCMVCGTECELRQNVEAAGNWMMAMQKKTRIYDVYSCLHLKAEWHEQAAYLYQAVDDAPSPRVAALIQLDLDDVLKANL